jgi:hypothetical protein
MITNDDQLNQAVEQLGRMYRALAALRRDVLPLNGRQFALMAEGPLDEIRKLQEQIALYTGKAAAEEHDSDVWLRILGLAVTWPDAPTSVLTAFLDAFRKGLQTVAEFTKTGHLTARPTKELKRACDLRVVAFQPGSLCVGVRLPSEDKPELFDRNDLSAVEQALQQYLEAARWVGSDVPHQVLEEFLPNSQARRIVLNALKSFVPRSRGDVERVEISGRSILHGQTIGLTRTAHQRIDEAIDLIAAEKVEEHVGDLREIDLDNLSFVLRNAEDVHEVRCVFEDDLLETAKEALDRRVQVTGVRRVIEGRRAAPALRVTRFEIIDEESSLSGAKT